MSLIIQVMPKMVHLKEKVRIILGMQRKMRNTASSDDKHLITDGNKAKENDDEANEDKKEEHESSDKGDSGDKLADSKIMARLARAPRRVKDPTFPEKYILHDGYK